MDLHVERISDPNRLPLRKCDCYYNILVDVWNKNSMRPDILFGTSKHLSPVLRSAKRAPANVRRLNNRK